MKSSEATRNYILQHGNPADEYCTGCGACKCICPTGALAIEQDSKGFYACNANERCIGCGKCLEVCPVANASEHEFPSLSASDAVYCFALKDSDRMRSSSGGVFYLLARKVLENGGYVCGCVWDDNLVARHIVSNKLEDIERMRSSKYVQSDFAPVLEEIQDLLNDSKVLISGTPCQIAGARALIGGNSNLLTCTFVCGGAPSPALWQQYGKELSNKHGSGIVKVDMRSKDTNWLIPELKVEFEDGRIRREVLLTENHYGVAFGNGLITMKSCTQCSFRDAALFADIVLSDHWGITEKELDQSGNKGMSAILLRTDTGRACFRQIKDQLFCIDGNLEDMKDSHLVMTKNMARRGQRDKFESQYRGSFISAVEKSLGAKWVLKNRIAGFITSKRFISMLTKRWRSNAPVR